MTTKRVPVRLTQDAWDELAKRASRDDVTMSDQIAALVEVWMTDADLQARIAPRAHELTLQHRSRKGTRPRKSP